jgi:hypothetical protein
VAIRQCPRSVIPPVGCVALRCARATDASVQDQKQMQVCEVRHARQIGRRAVLDWAI